MEKHFPFWRMKKKNIHRLSRSISTNYSNPIFAHRLIFCLIFGFSFWWAKGRF